MQAPELLGVAADSDDEDEGVGDGGDCDEEVVMTTNDPEDSESSDSSHPDFDDAAMARLLGLGLRTRSAPAR